MRIPSFLSALLFYSIVFSQEKGSVEIPLSTWEQMVDVIEAGKQPGHIDQVYCPVERIIEGAFHRGIFRGVLTARFTVFDSGHVRIPVIDGNATLGDVTLDGKSTSLYREDSMFTAGVEKPGIHTVRAEIIWGKVVDRFDRELSFKLPEAGPTRISIELPETGIDAVLKSGALLSSVEHGAATRLDGYLDASGKLDLTWSRRLSHTAKSLASEVKLYSIFTVQEALVTGQSLFRVNILEGEADRIDLRLPKEIEITDVTGDAVLQWRTDPKDGGRLIVLLRHLVQDQVHITVRFQFPVREGGEIALVMPLADTATAMTGFLGILSSPGLDVQITRADSATRMELRDLPSDLTDMTSTPFICGLSFATSPSVKLSATRLKEVTLTETLVDDLQASTVVIQDGLEITKMKLRIRNNNRQYLKMVLPPDARLTHSMIDGMPVRPALIKLAARDALLFPLQQSESISDGAMRYHIVRAGETLGDIANRYYSDPEMWRFIIKNNEDELMNPDDLMEGQRVLIAPRSGVRIQESSFLLELAYQRKSDKALGLLGSRSVSLPEIDLQTVQAVWHLYIPHVLDPVWFRSNLTQLTAIRYGIFTRMRDFVRNALVKKAWAGGGPEYSNILVKRKAIYKADYAKRSREETVLSSFPLVGQKYRFSRNLMGTETPRISFCYLPRWLSAAIAWIGFIAGFFLVFYSGSRWKNRQAMLLIGAGFIIMLVLAHFFLGMHQKILWGADAALLFSLIRLKAASLLMHLRSFVREPWKLAGLVTWGNIAVLVGISMCIALVLAFPMFFSSFLLILFLLLGRRQSAASGGSSGPNGAAVARIMIIGLFIVMPPVYSQDDYEAIDEQWDETEQHEQQSDEPEAAPEQQSEQARDAESEAYFNAIMQNQTVSQKRSFADHEPPPPAVVAPTEKQPLVKLPLDDYDKLRKKVNETDKRNNAPKGPPVILGASEYSGKTVHGSLSLRLTLQVTLGYPGIWKTVPLAGDDAILVSATVNGQPIPVSRRNKYHVWITDKTGEAEITADILVPSRGPRGSIEYDFRTVRTPSTTFTCEFPVEGLEPQLTAALQAESHRVPGATRFSATLRTTSRIHLIGFRDMGESDRQPARVYAESRNLLSIDKDALEMFSVFYYTILYSGAQKFTIFIPKGAKIVSADGRGAFRYNLEPSDSGVLLTGETEFPIRNNFEISLRLRRELRKNGEAFEVPLPRCRGVERESGWLGVEVPGKLQLEEKTLKDVLPIDMRQLPEEILRSAVSPILRAYQYHSSAAHVQLFASNLPEIEPASGSIDNIQAFTGITDKGDVLTDMRLTLRNRLRHNIIMKVPDGAEALSAMIDGEPLNISRDDAGYLLLPLKRSEGGEQLQPFTVSIVLKKSIRTLKWFGFPALELPSVDMPVSSMTWQVYVPGFNTYSRLRSDIDLQRYAGQVAWQHPSIEQDSYEPLSGGGNNGINPSPAASGAMPVQVKVPLSGTKLVYTRYWIEKEMPVRVSFIFIRSSLLIPFQLLLMLLIGAALFICLSGRQPSKTIVIAGATLLIASIAGFLIGNAAVPVIGLLAGFTAACIFYRWHLGVAAWIREAPAQFRNRQDKKEGEEKKRSFVQFLKGVVRFGAFVVMGMIFLFMLSSLVNLLMNHPL